MLARLRAVILALLLTAVPAPAEQALCIVCKVREGATQPEPVRAEHVRDGIRCTFRWDGPANPAKLLHTRK
jgi:hypothetical protein